MGLLSAEPAHTRAALIVGDKLLLLDEPFEGRAPVLAQRLIEVIASLREEGLSVCFQSPIKFTPRTYLMIFLSLREARFSVRKKDGLSEGLLSEEMISARYMVFGSSAVNEKGTNPVKAQITLLREIGASRPYTKSRPLEIVEAELGEPGLGQVLVKIAAAGLCHSDLSVINGNRPRDTPLALGHEASGIVEAVGPGVTRFSPGDHVVMVFIASCGHCVPCAEGRPALCEPGAVAGANGTLLNGDRKISVDSKLINHHLGVSAFSSHAVMSENSCIKIDKDVPLDRAALLGCAVLTGVGAVLNSGALKMGESCAIVGLGGVGLAGLLGAVAAGAGTIIAADISEAKRVHAMELGATHTIDPRDEDAVAKAKDWTNGGVDLAVDLAGAVPALQFAYDITRRGGTTVTAGLPHPDAKLSFPAVSLTAEERVLKGSYVGSCVPVRDIPRFAQMMQQGKLPIEKLMTHRLRPSEINEGFERLAAGEAIRQVIVFD